MTKRTTLCYLEHQGNYLMMLRDKKPNDPNQGKYVGVGGKFQPGEGPRDCALREIQEETGLSAAALQGLEFRGVVEFVSNVFEREDMYLFTCELPGAAPPELPDCPEGTLCWVEKSQVEGLNLWEGDRIFLRRLAAGDRDIRLRLEYEGDDLVSSVDMALAPADPELVDVYDEAGSLTGEVIPRKGASMGPGRYLHYATAVICDPAGRILITQRPLTKSWAAGWWELPGGGVKAGETPLEGCIREVREEVGLDVSTCTPTLLNRYRNDDPHGDNYWMDMYGFTLDFGRDDVHIQVEEIKDFALATWDNVVAIEESGEFLHFARLKTALGKD